MTGRPPTTSDDDVRADDASAPSSPQRALSVAMARFRRSGSPAEQILETMTAWRAPVRIALASVITVTVAVAFTLAVSSAERDDESTSALGAGAVEGDDTAPAGPGTAVGDAEGDGQTDTTDARVFDNPPVTGDRPQGGVGGSTVVGESGASASAPPTGVTVTTPPTDGASVPVPDDPTTGPTAPTTAATAPTTAPGATSATTAPTTTEAPTTTTTAPTTTTTVDDGSSTTSATGPPIVVRVEAESGTLLGAATARSDHEGHSGTGFVGDIFTEGSGVTLTVTAPQGGATPFMVRYAAGNNGPADLRTLTVVVNGEPATTAQMAVTASWSDWAVVGGEVDLVEGDNVISLLWAPGDTGWVNLDYIQLN
ncbi:MAG: CBM35 domain-containing protein [Actinomycetota bacterium]